MKEFPLIQGGCSRSAESVEFSAGALGGCVVAATVMLLIMMFIEFHNPDNQFSDYWYTTSRAAY